ncbi:alpha-ketoglutarate-dependent dioxygenase AlkB [Lysobacter sp. A6]|uniref:Alpha-ketoglutarate-dependent dioxygenase AlkB n=1 Tax=Noviluteimonas lactosilytica TaxID=2888523 RepID=A0ABS8JE04_9GAMM|nr:alpha-ketoglutarate-dependent dioxygenase AlkB [Lysobacter lactosilyticus]MCC8361846.1 alpha-ketoglutarate-dependent dioxygenase AlkB [Lysobacter lactosilyticus]
MQAVSFAADLFSQGPRTLIDDHEGGCVYHPAFIDAARADAWFAALRDEVEWRKWSRPMYDRVVDVPRLTSGYTVNDVEAMPPALAAACEAIRAHTGVPFTHVGCNFYRDGNDSVAPHNDKLATLIAGHPIVLLSLGDARRMEIREKQPPRRVVRIDLESGSLLTMSHAMQYSHDHGIPKTRHAVGPRISLAFRVRPPMDDE